MEDSKGKLWIGTNDGVLHQFDSKKQQFIRHPPWQNDYGIGLTSIIEEMDGTLRVGTSNAGLLNYTPEKKHYRHYKSNFQNKTSLNDNTIFSL